MVQGYGVRFVLKTRRHLLYEALKMFQKISGSLCIFSTNIQQKSFDYFMGRFGLLLPNDNFAKKTNQKVETVERRALVTVTC